MTAYTDPVDIIIMQLRAGAPGISLSGAGLNIDKLFAQAFDKAPELLFIVESYQAQWRKDNLFTKQYWITLNYAVIPKFRLQDVTRDEGAFDIERCLKSLDFFPERLYIASTCADQTVENMNRKYELLFDLLPGLNAVEYQQREFEGSRFKQLTVSFQYKMPPAQLYAMNKSARQEAKAVAASLYGAGKLPPFLKVFLAFSYLQLNVRYNDPYMADLKRGQAGDCSPALAFGALVNHSAVCEGIAEAFYLLMQEAGIECVRIDGIIRPDEETLHRWNLVKLNGQYYHIDATWGIQDDGVYIGGFLRDDLYFVKTHGWADGTYPAARGRLFNYDYVEQYVDSNIDELIRCGINPAYLSPTIIE